MARKFLTKESIVARLEEVTRQGWIKSLRPLNSGGIGNTIDSLLGLTENNMGIADTAQWEIKSHRVGSASLLTLFHMEPEPRKERLVSKLLLPGYGWPDQHGRVDELSFRQTLRANSPTDRGFSLGFNDTDTQIQVQFDANVVQSHHRDWLQSVHERTGLGPLDPIPYWTMQALFLKTSTKMLNTVLVEAHTKRQAGEEFFAVSSVQILQGLDIDHFTDALRRGNALIDFDARTGHNHGTKFRIRQNIVPQLYRYAETPIGPLEPPAQ